MHFASTPKNEKMFELALRLRERYKIGIITDNKKDRMDYLRTFQRLDELFDSVVVSAEVGYDKRNERIFQKALLSLNTQPENTIFIDNTKENLIIPGEMGFKTILFDQKTNNIDSLMHELTVFGVRL